MNLVQKLMFVALMSLSICNSVGAVDKAEVLSNIQQKVIEAFQENPTKFLATSPLFVSIPLCFYNICQVDYHLGKNDSSAQIYKERATMWGVFSLVTIFLISKLKAV